MFIVLLSPAKEEDASKSKMMKVRTFFNVDFPKAQKRII
jgi:hypothetical protein